MGDTLIDMFAQGIDAFITSLIVSFMVIMLSHQQTMASIVAENHNTALEMQEYREYNAYSGKHVYAADIISLILKKKGYPEIEVQIGSESKVWSLSRTDIAYNIDALYVWIDPQYIYDADIYYEDMQYRTGVKKIRFKACTNSNCRY